LYDIVVDSTSSSRSPHLGPFFEVMSPPATAETHLSGWRNWQPSALSALGGAAHGSSDFE